MKHLGLVVLVAVASSLVTAGALELFRSQPRTSTPEVAARGPSSGSPSAAAPPTVRSETTLATPDLEARLRDLEERLARVEAGGPSRQPVGTDATSQTERAELRDLVLAWIAEERERRRLEAERETEAKRQQEHEFGVRAQVASLAREHSLSDWQKEKLVEVWLEVETRRRELEQSIDPLTDDPEDVERRFEEFEAWSRRRVDEELGAGLATEIFGESTGG